MRKPEEILKTFANEHSYDSWYKWVMRNFINFTVENRKYMSKPKNQEFSDRDTYGEENWEE